jgi:hypothetical protein
VAGTNVQLVNLIEEINTSLRALTSQVNDLEEANNDLERRLLPLEASSKNQATLDSLYLDGTLL